MWCRATKEVTISSELLPETPCTATYSIHMPLPIPPRRKVHKLAPLYLPDNLDFKLNQSSQASAVTSHTISAGWQEGGQPQESLSRGPDESSSGGPCSSLVSEQPWGGADPKEVCKRHCPASSEQQGLGLGSWASRQFVPPTPTPKRQQALAHQPETKTKVCSHRISLAQVSAVCIPSLCSFASAVLRTPIVRGEPIKTQNTKASIFPQ